jgi:hypothetical protein
MHGQSSTVPSSHRRIGGSPEQRDGSLVGSRAMKTTPDYNSWCFIFKEFICYISLPLAIKRIDLFLKVPISSSTAPSLFWV